MKLREDQENRRQGDDLETEEFDYKAQASSIQRLRNKYILLISLILLSATGINCTKNKTNEIPPTGKANEIKVAPETTETRIRKKIAELTVKLRVKAIAKCEERNKKIIEYIVDKGS